ncbi:hypothetical protein CYMTET_5343, partial [Cymbomonas tetramitiformis]
MDDDIVGSLLRRLDPTNRSATLGTTSDLAEKFKTSLSTPQTPATPANSGAPTPMKSSTPAGSQGSSKLSSLIEENMQLLNKLLGSDSGEQRQSAKELGRSLGEQSNGHSPGEMQPLKLANSSAQNQQQAALKSASSNVQERPQPMFTAASSSPQALTQPMFNAASGARSQVSPTDASSAVPTPRRGRSSSVSFASPVSTSHVIAEVAQTETAPISDEQTAASGTSPLRATAAELADTPETRRRRATAILRTSFAPLQPEEEAKLLHDRVKSLDNELKATQEELSVQKGRVEDAEAQLRRQHELDQFHREQSAMLETQLNALQNVQDHGPGSMGRLVSDYNSVCAKLHTAMEMNSHLKEKLLAKEDAMQAMAK